MTIRDALVGRIRQSGERVVASVAALDDDQLGWSAGPAAPSIGFHAWHAARWADRMAAHLATVVPEVVAAGCPTVQRWVADDLARRWGFDHLDLGRDATGLGMDEAVSTALPLPARDLLLDYCRAAFAAIAAAVGAMDDEILVRTITGLTGPDDSAFGVVMVNVSHTDRHLGMIEALRGVRGARGTASL